MDNPYQVPNQQPEDELGPQDDPVPELRSSRNWPVNGLIACGVVLLATAISFAARVHLLLGLEMLLFPFALVGLPIFGVLALTKTRSPTAGVVAGATIGVLGTVLILAAGAVVFMFVLMLLGFSGIGLR